MPETSLAKTEKTPVATSYSHLRERVRQVLLRGEERARALVEGELIRTSWRVGRLLDRHIRAEKKTDSDRAAYGKDVVRRLAEDLRRSPTQLYAALKFARTYHILPAPGELTWTHYVKLLSIKDPAARREIENQIRQSRWSSRLLASRLKAGWRKAGKEKS